MMWWMWVGCRLWIPAEAVDDRIDGDRDGFLAATLGGPDCDDTDPAVRPGAEETWYDGVDQDCLGDDDFDQDRDGRRSAAHGGDDCDDTDPTVGNRAPIWRPDCDGDGRPGVEAVRACEVPREPVCDGGQPRRWIVESPLLETDCDDRDPAIPAADDPPYDGIDADCDGANDYDADGDGFVPDAYLELAPFGSRGGDCDDELASRNPAAQEIPYDGVDGDCDGLNDYDADGDGFVAADFVDQFPGAEPDCDDRRADTHPGAPEVWYDGRDQDCAGGDDYDADGDGVRSPLSPVGEGPFDCDDGDPDRYPGNVDPPYDGLDADCAGNDDHDQDGDGFPGVVRPDLPAMPLDCDDLDPTVFPGAVEDWSDDVDQDCDGNADDQDGDGYARDVDCDDEDPRVHPDAVEIGYDGVDQDCDGLTDDQDLDGDGVPAPTDCDDLDPAVFPGAPEVWYDGVDQDCSFSSDFDQDGDGWVADADCDDLDPTVRPGAAEVAYDGVDQDCDGSDLDDLDGDGSPHPDDCDDLDPTVFPGATEAWYDGVDQDCDGADDFDRDGDGRPHRAFCVVGRVPMDPRCDDADCDDTVAGPDDCFFTRDEDDDGYPAPLDCDDTDAQRSPLAAEIPYDGIDQDCDGTDLRDVDGDGFERPLDCDDTDPAIHPDSLDLLAGAPGGPRDRNCDGLVGDALDTDGDGVEDAADCAPQDATRWIDAITVAPTDDLPTVFARLCPTATLTLSPGVHLVDAALRNDFDALLIEGDGATLAPAAATRQLLDITPHTTDLALTVRGVAFRGGVDPHPGDGGCLSVEGGSGAADVCLDGVTFDGCGSLARGGAVHARQADVFLRAARFVGNSADRGGAVYVEGALTGRDVGFVGNEAGEGGAVDLVGPARLDLADTWFTSNTAIRRGGALQAGPAIDAVTFADLDFASNEAPDGAALHVTGLFHSGAAPRTPTCLLPSTVSRPAGGLTFQGDRSPAVADRPTDPTFPVVGLYDHGLDLDGLTVDQATAQVGVLFEPATATTVLRDVRVTSSSLRRGVVVRGAGPDQPAVGGVIEGLLVWDTRNLEFALPVIQPRWRPEEAAVVLIGPPAGSGAGARPTVRYATVARNRQCVQVLSRGESVIEHAVIGQPADPGDWVGLDVCRHPGFLGPFVRMSGTIPPAFDDVHFTHGRLFGSSMSLLNDCDLLGAGVFGCTTHLEDPYVGGVYGSALGRLRPDSAVELLGDAPGYWNAP
jgi:hypothetical protein